MNDIYSIYENTLTTIGDALRVKFGETKTILVDEYYEVLDVEGMEAYKSYVYNYYFPEATSIEIRYKSQVSNGDSFGKVYYASGEYTEETFPKIEDNYLPEVNTTVLTTITLEDTNSLTVYQQGGPNISPWGFYMEIMGLDKNGYPIQTENTVKAEVERVVKNVYSPAEMAEAIYKLPDLNTGGEEIVLTGEQKYGCAGQLSSNYINMFGSTISTKDLTNAEYMFKGYTNNTIPFDINFTDSIYNSMDYVFSGSWIQALPKVNNYYGSYLRGLFADCRCLKEIPEDFFDNVNFDRVHTYTYVYLQNMFSGCYSLRKIPSKALSQLWGSGTNYNNTLYSGGFRTCKVLDEVIDIPIHQGALSSSAFGTTFEKCFRLKNIIFATNEDGTPKTAKWKNQTIDLTIQIGYCNENLDWGITGKSEGFKYGEYISSEGAVSTAEEYHAKKDSPDWYAYGGPTFSRYNHDSAVATINSLPDTSAYLATAGGTNTIKFTGTAGSGTDGGAISNLTAEEIAVATAKGWTVSLV